MRIATTSRLIAAFGPTLAVGVFVFGVSPRIDAAAVGSLPTFASGQPIRASDFNGAFSTLRTAIDDNNTRIGNLTTLNTTAKGDLVSAINEVRQTAGTGQTGPQGPTGPAGPTRISFCGYGPTTPGGNTNQWTGGAQLTTLQINVGAIRASQVAGRPYTATVRIQTSNPAVAGGDNPGNPLVAGNLVLDLRWTYGQYGLGTANAPVLNQTAVATVVIDAAQFNNKVVTFSGTAPTPATTAGGYTAPHLLGVQVFVNGTTTAQGQCYTAFDMDVTPP